MKVKLPMEIIKYIITFTPKYHEAKARKYWNRITKRHYHIYRCLGKFPYRRYYKDLTELQIEYNRYSYNYAFDDLEMLSYPEFIFKHFIRRGRILPPVREYLQERFAQIIIDDEI